MSEPHGPPFEVQPADPVYRELAAAKDREKRLDAALAEALVKVVDLQDVLNTVDGWDRENAIMPLHLVKRVKEALAAIQKEQGE